MTFPACLCPFVPLLGLSMPCVTDVTHTQTKYVRPSLPACLPLSPCRVADTRTRKRNMSALHSLPAFVPLSGD